MSPSHGPYRAPPPIPRPAFPRISGALITAVICGLLAAYTSSKLQKMEILRGERPGAPERTMRVIPGTRSLGADTIEFSLYDPIANDSYRIQARAHQYARLQLGNIVSVRCDDEHECYFRDSVYIDDGNLGFDHGLRTFEFIGLGGAIAWLLIALSRWRIQCAAVDAANRRPS